MCVTIYGQVALLARVPWSFAIEKVFSSSRRNVTREFNFLFDFSPALTGIAASLVQVFCAYLVNSHTAPNLTTGNHRRLSSLHSQRSKTFSTHSYSLSQCYSVW